MKPYGTVQFIEHAPKRCTVYYWDRGPYGKRETPKYMKASWISERYTEIMNKIPVIIEEDSTIPGVPVLFYVWLLRNHFFRGPLKVQGQWPCNFSGPLKNDKTQFRSSHT